MTQKNALKIMLGLLLLVILFHSMVLFQVIPYSIVWAGKLNSFEEMLVFEIISIAVNMFLIGVLLVKSGYFRSIISPKIINGIIWLFVLIFALNTIGNLFSKSWIELILGTSLTLISTILCFIIVYSGGQKFGNNQIEE